MKTAVSIPDPVFDAAERVSKCLRVSRSRFYTMAIERMLKTQRSRGVQEALDEVYAKRDSRLDRVLAAMQRASLATEENDW
ncbi:MAG: hypothetical protein WBC04_15385 [Candidatus Acidiferrales bacterium]